MEGGDSLKNSLSWLHGVINGKIGHGLEAIVLQGLRVVHAEKGFMRFDFVVPNAVSYSALASLLDVIGIVTIYSFANRIITTVDFNVSYYSKIKIQEHVEIESKVNANRGKLMHVVVEVRRKGNGEVIAEGKLWMAANKLTLAQVSKL
ncbi:Thioesterase superfamily [Gossypium australe]|uniref:Thioesterase superfamily n=1 Tax=Gossypium australe TaxID=47621 RepID=A0A5B6UPI0_9ROSI|nr:Thioesterase superfamily [Gossypium australe]